MDDELEKRVAEYLKRRLQREKIAMIDEDEEECVHEINTVLVLGEGPDRDNRRDRHRFINEAVEFLSQFEEM